MGHLAGSVDWPRISRRVNRRLGGGHEMLCARCYRTRLWWAVAALDLMAFLLWGERGHCRRVYRDETPVSDAMPDRARRAGL